MLRISADKQGVCCVDMLQSAQNFIVAAYVCDCSSFLLQLKPVIWFCSVPDR